MLRPWPTDDPRYGDLFAIVIEDAIARRYENTTKAITSHHLDLIYSAPSIAGSIAILTRFANLAAFPKPSCLLVSLS